MTDSTPRGPLGDARPDAKDAPAQTPGSLPQAKVEDRESVGTIRPEDYPKAERDDGDVAADNRGRRAPKQGSGPVTGSGAGAGGGGNPEDYDSDPQGGGGHAAAPANDHGPKSGADAPVGGSR
jgi:hypothetical protein